MFRKLAVIFAVFASLSTTIQAVEAQETDNRICNETDRELFVAVSYVQGPIFQCGMSGSGCYTKTKGWWKINPGRCLSVTKGIWHQSYVSISFSNDAGKTDYAEFPVDKRILNGRRIVGSSGVRNQTICVRTEAFERSDRGSFYEVFNSTCIDGHRPVPISLFIQGSDRRNAITRVQF